jgi:hypothetical protein
MAISLLTLWADGLGALVAVPPAGKMLSGWVGDEQPPADWENWINKTTIDKINEMIPVVNNGIDMVNGGSYLPIGPIFWDFSGFTSPFLPADFLVKGDDLNPAFGVLSSAPLASVYFSNSVGQALRVIGDTAGLAPSKSPFRLSPLKAVPATMEGGDLCIVNGSLVFFDKTDNYTHVVHSSRVDFDSVFLSLVDMATNETAGVRDWNFNAGGLPTFISSRNARPCYSAYWALLGPLHHQNVHLNSIQLQVTPGAARAAVAQRMTVNVINGLTGTTLSATGYDNGTNSKQYMAVICDIDLNFKTQNPIIEIGPGSTNGIDVIWEVMINFEVRAN